MNRGLQITLCMVAMLGCVAADVAAADADAAMPRSLGEKLITIQTAKTEIVDALRLVAEQGGMNLVIGPDVTGPVSLYLENVPVEAALRAIAVNNGFTYTVEDGLITVSKPAGSSKDGKPAGPPLATRIFTLQCQDAERIKDVLEYALTPAGKIKVLNENSKPGYGMTKLSDLGGDAGTNGATSGYGNTTGRVSPSRASSDVNLGLATGTGSVNSGSGGELPKNARTLVVTDTEENLVRIAELIADLDRLPPQVLIEARIVEMTTDLQRQLGIDWDVNVLANGPTLNHTLPLEWRAGFAPGSQIRYAPDGTPRSENGMSLGTIDFSRFTAMVRVHATDNAIRLLANPRLLVYNNHSASILVGERYPLLQANITDQGTLTEALDTYVPVGIQLEVTPTITADGRVSMLVHPVTSALGDEVVGTTGLRVRRILTREIDTRIVMHDGQTVVLGGLISDRKSRTVNKIPGLGDLPGVDVLFRQESPTSQRVDLLVFLTARIEGATEISERDRTVFDMYRPQFKQIDRLQQAQLHFEIPTEYETPKAEFGDPADADGGESGDSDAGPPPETTALEWSRETPAVVAEPTRQVAAEPVAAPAVPVIEPPTAFPQADPGEPSPRMNAAAGPEPETAGRSQPAGAGRLRMLKTRMKDAVECVRRRISGETQTQDKTVTTPMVQSDEVP